MRRIASHIINNCAVTGFAVTAPPYSWDRILPAPGFFKITLDIQCGSNMPFVSLIHNSWSLERSRRC